MKDALTKFLSRFNEFDQIEIQAIVDNTSLELFKKRTVILSEGEVCTKCYFILQGCIRQYQLIDGEEKTSALFTEEQATVLYASYLNKEPSKYSLCCVEDSIVISGTREQEEKLHEQFPKLKYLVYTVMRDDYLKSQERIASFINHTPEERYLMLMEHQPSLLNRVPLHQLASYIGVTPESFSRIRKRTLTKQKSR